LLRAGRLSQATIARQPGVSRTAVTKWKKQLAESGWRGLKARRPRRCSHKRLVADIIFEDEFGFSFCEPVATTWAPRGQTQCSKESANIGVKSQLWSG
jgi:hypothetical protein